MESTLERAHSEVPFPDLSLMGGRGWRFPEAAGTGQEKWSWLPKLGLCSLVPNRNAETEFWVKQKRVTFTALLGKGVHSGPNTLRSRDPSGGSGEEFSSVQRAECDQPMDNYWIGWNQGEVSNIINFLVSACLGSRFFFSLQVEGVCFLKKQLRDVYQAFISFREP